MLSLIDFQVKPESQKKQLPIRSRHRGATKSARADVLDLIKDPRQILSDGKKTDAVMAKVDSLFKDKESVWEVKQLGVRTKPITCKLNTIYQHFYFFQFYLFMYLFYFLTLSD